jgi:hypothetical protein
VAGVRRSVAAVTRFGRLALAPACASLLVLASCGADDPGGAPADTAGSVDEQEAAPATPTSDPATAADGPLPDQTVGDEAVPEILRFSAPSVGGGEIDAAALAGTPTVFWFWAPT